MQRVGKPRRPGPLRWVWYAFGGALPAKYREWVFHDTTCSTWVLRHAARALVQLSLPVVAALLFIPAPMDVRVLTVFAAGLPSVLFTLGYVVQSNEHRLIKAGYPAGIGEITRTTRSNAAHNEANARRRERIAARRARRAAIR